MLKTIRRTLALIFFIGITLLFLDFTGVASRWLGWMARVQFLPALMALNFGVVACLVILTLIFGRVYCSVICPLGVMQDGFGALGKRSRRYRYSYSRPLNILRYGVLALLIVAMIAGLGWIVALFAPYSAYGRIVQNLLGPVWAWGNNILADIAEQHQSYAFYTTEVWVRSWITFGVAAGTLVLLAVLSWRNGRTWCNTICPVGTILGFFSRFSWLRPVIDTSKCNSCGLCARQCKASCIDSKNHAIDLSRCVACMDCIDACHQGAISYSRRRNPVAVAHKEVSAERRAFMTGLTIAAGTAVVKAKTVKVDGGLAAITDKKIPARKAPVVPAGAQGIDHLTSRCTACQLCVAACPNGVLRPSDKLDRLMQPESSFERGYCRPECTRCSEVCPAGAILPVTAVEKSSIQTGHAVWVRENCIPLTDGVECGNCARHCPVGAIQMVPSDPSDPESRKIPVVNDERCIGCGACENLCPSRPFSAIYVEGHEKHRVI